jgi:L-rhamnose isomerase/sugar isomerase
MRSIDNLAGTYGKSSDELEEISARIGDMKVSMPLWLSLDAGTRFGKITAKDAAKDVWEAMDRQKTIHELTGAADSIVWGSMPRNDIAKIREESSRRGLHVDTIHAYFSGEAASYGSIANVKKEQRDLSLKQIESCIQVMRGTGAKNLSLWFKDGTNYPGQADFTKRYYRMLGVLKEAYAMLDADMTMLIEYKFFEPAMYHTDIADWGTAVAICGELGDQAKVIIDLGHHAQSTNIPATLASVFRSGKMGAIHFNDNKYGDDDLIVGALDPFRLFLIFHELLSQEKFHGQNIKKIPLIIDQSLVVEEKLPGMLYTVLNMQVAFAKALLVNMDELAAKQDANDVIGATRILRKAFEYDVRPLLQFIRERKGLPADPFAALEGKL